MALQKDSKRKSHTLDDDPRPKKYRNMPGKSDRLYALMVNYTCAHGQDLNLRYMYKRADLQTAVKDHDYFSVPYTHLWVLDNIKVSKISVERL